MADEKLEFPKDYYQYDKENFKKFLEGIHEDIRETYFGSFPNISLKKFDSIIICGMGGSGAATDLLKIYLEGQINIEAVKDYSLPKSVTENDLIIISSYSGNTEEAISCYRNARTLDANVIFLTSGGKLEETATQVRAPIIKLPKGYPPRSTVVHAFFSILRLLEYNNLIKRDEEKINDLIAHLQRTDFKSLGINLSEKFTSKIPVIYTSNKYYGLALRWKTQFNENAKMPCFANYFPELNHNELESFTIYQEMFHIVMLSFDDDLARMKKRITKTKEAITKNGVSVTELDIKGDNLVKIFSAMILGDYASYYTALRHKKDPLPVHTIESFKKSMGPFI